MVDKQVLEPLPNDRVLPGRIFVLGRNRSGTKWLTNQISNHPEVAAITAAGTGVLEANLFGQLPQMFGDLEINDHYYAFLAAFMKSSFFHRSGLPESVLYERRHTDYLEFFAWFMDRLAEVRGTKFWLQKGSSLMFPVLLRTFPDAKFIVMRREDVLANVRSSVALRGAGSAEQHKPRMVARELASYYLHRAIELDHLELPNVRLATYERLRSDKEGVLREVCEFLGLEFSAALLEDSFPPNTSYRKSKPEEVFTGLDNRTFALLQPLFRSLPTPFLRALHGARGRSRPRKGQRLLIAGSFKTFRREVEALQAAKLQAETLQSEPLQSEPSPTGPEAGADAAPSAKA